jgi:E3 ubiquitin-protein ligase TRIP12
MSEEYANSENGKKLLVLFGILGKFVARSMLDSRIIDISFNPTLFRIGNSVTAVTPSLGAVEFVDKSLARSLRQLKRAVMQKKVIQEDECLSAAERTQLIQDITVSGATVSGLALDFTLPGYPDIELCPNGAHTAVTIWNLDEYIAKVMDFTLGVGVYRQVEAFQAGFSKVFPYAAIHAFTPDELVMLYGRVDEDWSLESAYIPVVLLC